MNQCFNCESGNVSSNAPLKGNATYHCLDCNYVHAIHAVNPARWVDTAVGDENKQYCIADEQPPMFDEVTALPIYIQIGDNCEGGES